MRLIVLSPFLMVGRLLWDGILLSTIASISILLLFRLGVSELDDIEDDAPNVAWLDGDAVMATRDILRAAVLFVVGLLMMLSLLVCDDAGALLEDGVL